MIIVYADTYQLGVDFLKANIGQKPGKGVIVVTPGTINRHMVGPFQSDHVYRVGHPYDPTNIPRAIFNFRATCIVLLELASIHNKGIHIMEPPEEDQDEHPSVQEHG